MTDALRRRILAFIRGETSADEVVAAVKDSPTEPAPRPKTTDQILTETVEDYVSVTPWNETWDDVERMWSLLTSVQQQELTRARTRAGK